VGDERAVTLYVSHVASERSRLVTACGMPWQQWQAQAVARAQPGHPPPYVFSVPPAGPVPTLGVEIVLCEACRQIVIADKLPAVVVEGLVIEPGDKVLVCLPDAGRLTREMAEMLQRILTERFPGSTFTVVSATEIAVQRAQWAQQEEVGGG
jgi:hypothetical protein